MIYLLVSGNARGLVLPTILKWFASLKLLYLCVISVTCVTIRICHIQGGIDQSCDADDADDARIRQLKCDLNITLGRTIERRGR